MHNPFENSFFQAGNRNLILYHHAQYDFIFLLYLCKKKKNLNKWSHYNVGQSCLPGDLPRTSYSLDLQEVRTGQTKLWVTSCPIGLFAKVTRKQIL